jgi:RNA polymerase sigma-70 factor (ECF subfamily)
LYIRRNYSSGLKNIDENIEKSLVLEIKQGNAKAFDQIFGFYGKRLYYFSLGYLKSKNEAEEVVQEVFYKIWKNRGSINTGLSFKAYIFKIAFNHIQELFQKLNLENAYRHELVATGLSSSNELENRIDYQSLLELVDQLIEQLPERQKEVLIRKRKYGHSIKEIANDMGISPKTAENHLTEALKKLKNNLSEEAIAGLLFFHLFVKSASTTNLFPKQ